MYDCICIWDVEGAVPYHCFIITFINNNLANDNNENESLFRRETLRKEVVSLFLYKNDTLCKSESVIMGYIL